MYYLNKIVWFFLNPVTVPIVIGIVALVWRKRILGWLALGIVWFESTLTCVCLLGIPLERPYVLAQGIERLPEADAVVLLGGGIGKSEEMDYPDMYEAADRVWHAARLIKAGKAPKLVVSGSNDLSAAVPLLLDFGVPREAIVVDNESRNTYENSRFTEKLLGEKKKVLLVTSAWHMPRARGNFAKTSLEVVPAPSDFSVYNVFHGAKHWWDWLAPSADSIARSNYLFKEWLGRLARK